MIHKVFALLIVLLMSSHSFADSACIEAPFFPVHWAYSGALVIVHLKNGETIAGSVISSGEGVITLRTYGGTRVGRHKRDDFELPVDQTLGRIDSSRPSIRWEALRSRPIEFIFDAHPAEFAYE